MSEQNNKKNVLISSILLVLSVAMLAWLGTKLWKTEKLDKITQNAATATQLPKHEATQKPELGVVVETPTPKPNKDENTPAPANSQTEDDGTITFD